MSQFIQKPSQNSKNSNQEREELGQNLTQFLNLKVSRAVDRLLMENDVSYTMKIYSHLQQTVKQNTSQLRQVLYQKHQNLINCSDMIDRLNFFAQKIKDVQQKIDQITNKHIQEDQQFQSKQASPIQMVQKLMSKRQFLKAFQKCRYFLQQSIQIKEQDRYYLSFFKLEIVDCLQEYLLEKPQTPELITEMILALKQFLSFTSFVQISQISMSQKSDRQNQSQSLIDLLYQKGSEKKRDSEIPVNQRQPELDHSDLLQVIFKFKLFSLNKQPKQQSTHLSNQLKYQKKFQRVFSFFNDLNHLLSQNVDLKLRMSPDKSQNRAEAKKLNNIFKINIEKVMHNLSQIFIEKVNKDNSENSQKKNLNQNRTKSGPCMPILSFQYKLYEQLLNNKKFTAIIQSLSKQLFDQNHQQKGITLNDHIKTLWYDYYRQFLQFICQEVNPLVQQGIFSLRRHYPDQFLPFITNNYIRTTYQKLKEYDGKVQSFVKNINELILKSKKEKDFQDIIDYLKKIIENFNFKIQKYQQQFKCNNSQLGQQKLREYLLMVLCSQNFNSKIVSYFSSLNNFDVSSLDCSLGLLFNIELFCDSALIYFEKQNQRILNIQEWQLKMDGFIGIYQGSKMKRIECQKIKQICMKIIHKKLQLLKKN